MNPVDRYVQTRNETASRERLMALLFEAAGRHIRLGAEALEAGHRRDAVASLTRASDIVAQLEASLDPSRAPELCENLSQVYAFVSVRLTQAAVAKDVEAAREAERVFRPVMEAFLEIVQPAAEPGTGAAP